MSTAHPDDQDRPTTPPPPHAPDAAAPQEVAEAASQSRPTLDLDSWNRFSPSLARLLGDSNRSGAADADAPAAGAVTRAGEEVQGPVTVRLRAAEPIVSAETIAHRLPERGVLGLLRRRRRLSPSTLAPALVAWPLPTAVMLAVPQLDEDGRALLGDDALGALTALGWQRQADALVRRMADAQAAAELVTRVLIEVFDVAHPADLSVVIEPTGPNTVPTA